MECQCQNRAPTGTVFGVSLVGDICRVDAPIALPFVALMVESNTMDAGVQIEAQQRYDELRDCSRLGNCKARPCVVVPSLQYDSGPPICLMATFGKQHSSRWPRIFRDFAHPLSHWKQDDKEGHFCDGQLYDLMDSMRDKKKAWEKRVRSQKGGAGADYRELITHQREEAGSRRSKRTSFRDQSVRPSVHCSDSSANVQSSRSVSTTSTQQTFASEAHSFNQLGPSSRQGSYPRKHITSLTGAFWSRSTPLQEKPEFTESNFPTLSSAQPGTQAPNLATITETEEGGLISKMKVLKIKASFSALMRGASPSPGSISSIRVPSVSRVAWGATPIQISEKPGALDGWPVAVSIKSQKSQRSRRRR
ncbi:hypothetical protein C8R46DRAFT_1188271 [Mycena filopes]|nr:hypothetical protein C8R46DRAFT_1188271 [Mycena filopes]